MRRWLVRLTVLALTFGSGFVALAQSAWACTYEVEGGECVAVTYTSEDAALNYPESAPYDGGCPGEIVGSGYGGGDYYGGSSYGGGDYYGGSSSGGGDYYGGSSSGGSGSANESPAGSGCYYIPAATLGISAPAGSMATVCSGSSGPAVSGPPQSSSSPPPPNVGNLASTVLSAAKAKAQAPFLVLSPDAQGFVDFPELLGVKPLQSLTSSTTKQGVTVSVTLTPSSVNFTVAGDEYLGITDQASFSCSYSDAIQLSQMSQSQIDQLRQQESGMSFVDAQQSGAQNSGCTSVPWYAFANMTGGPNEQPAPGNPSASTAQVTASVVYTATWSVSGASTPSNLSSTVTGPTASVSLPVGSAESPLCYGQASCQS